MAGSIGTLADRFKRYLPRSGLSIVAWRHSRNPVTASQALLAVFCGLAASL
jgi:hypothetical protein